MDAGGELAAARARARSQFPDHEVDVAFSVCLPVYEARLRVLEMERSRLSAPALYVLRAADSGLGSPGEIAEFLGLADGEVVGIAAELLNAGLIVQGANGNVEVTDNGRKVVREGGATLRPRKRYPRVPYDPLTRKIVGIALEDLISREKVRREGLFVAPIGPKKPRLSNIRLAEVKDYEDSFGGWHRNAETLQVSAITDAKLQYRRDVVLVRMVSRAGNEEIFAAYRARQFLEEETAAIEGLVAHGVEFLPLEARGPEGGGTAIARATSAQERDILREIDELDQAADNRSQEVLDAKVAQHSTSDEAAASMEHEVERLRRAEENLLLQLAEKQKELARQSEERVRWIRTEEHRPLLLEAAARAVSELTIVSAWVGSSGLDAELCRALAKAVSRGVTVRIAWGLGTRRGRDADRNRARGEEAIKNLRHHIRETGTEKLVVVRTETHEKFIVCDDRFCALGSFNWLSYQGKRDHGYRREASLYSERKTDIELCQRNAQALFDRA